MKVLFVRRESTISYNPKLASPSGNSVLKDINSLRYFGSIIRNSLLTEIRDDHSILSFLSKIKQWKPITCPCAICKSYIDKVGKVSDY